MSEIMILRDVIVFLRSMALCLFFLSFFAAEESGSPNGFFKGGWYHEGAYQGVIPDDAINPMGSWKGDVYRGGYATPWVVVTSVGVEFYARGYPNSQGNALFIESSDGGLLRPVSGNPGERWVRQSVSLPEGWIGKRIRIKGVDDSTNPMGWFAFSEPVFRKWNPLSFFQPFEIGLVGVCVVFLLIVLIGQGLSLIIRGRSSPESAMVMSGFSALGAFWLCVVSTLHYEVLFFIILIAGAVYGFVKRKTIPALSSDMLLALCGLVFCWIFLCAGGVPDFETSATRFLGYKLPMDNMLPSVFAEQAQSRSIQIPMIGDWHSSDRPPLQTAYQILFSPINILPFTVNPPPFGLLIGMACQALSVMAAVRLFDTLFVGCVNKPLVAIFIIASPTFLINGIFTWPKLLGAAFFMLCVGRIIRAIRSDHRRVKFYLFLEGWCLAGFSLLSHGALAFACLGLFVGIFICPPLRKTAGYWECITGVVKRNFFAAIVSSLVLLPIMGPWFYYKKHQDPPGNRLEKWHLAGVESATDTRGIIGSLIQSYQSLSFKDLVKNKAANISRPLEKEFEQIPSIAAVLAEPTLVKSGDKHDLFGIWFFNILASTHVLGFCSLVIFLTARSWRALSFVSYSTLVSVLISTWIVWSLLMYSPSSTVIHQGPLTLPVMLTGLMVLVLSVLNKYIVSMIAVLYAAISMLVLLPGKDGVELNKIMSVVLFVMLIVLILFSLFNNSIHKKSMYTKVKS